MTRSTINNEQWYKSMLVGNAPFLPSDYELIETVILGSNQASVVFSSLGTYSSTYKHLQLRFTARSAASASEDTIYARFNSDTGANYSAHQLYGTGSSVLSAGYANLTYAFCGTPSGNTATANAFGAGVIDILDPFSTTKNKTTRSLTGQVGTSIKLWSGNWRNTASVTTILLAAENGNLMTGSRFSLYGIRG
jgi:hypothetical protein